MARSRPRSARSTTKRTTSIIKAWTEPEVFAFNGKYTKLRYINLWPKPIQQPHPPIWVPGGGSVETWDFCADHGYQYSFLSYFGYIAGKKVADGYWNVMAKKGKELNPYSLGFAQGVAVANTDEEAERLYSPHMDYFYNRCLHVYNGFADAPGYRTTGQHHSRGRPCPSWQGSGAQARRADLEGFRRSRLHHRRLTEDCARAAARSDEESQLRSPDDPSADRLYAARTGAQEYGTVRARK